MSKEDEQMNCPEEWKILEEQVQELFLAHFRLMNSLIYEILRGDEIAIFLNDSVGSPELN